MKRAMFGGSFNPVHNDHIKLALRFADEFGLDKVTLIPTHNTPLKDNSYIADGEHRLNMCRLACGDHPRLEVSDIEVRRGGVSYTSDTIARIKGDDDFFLIVGADMFFTLDKWHDFRYIFENASILVAPRNELDAEALLKKYEEYKIYGCRAYISGEYVGGLSSTAVRSAVQRGESISGMVDGRVEEYILKNGLYR